MKTIHKVRKVWTKRDGTKIPIYKMTDEHLINTIKMLERNAVKSRDITLQECILACSMLQGEMALEHCDRTVDTLSESDSEEMFLHPLYDDLMLDAQRRGLKIE